MVSPAELVSERRFAENLKPYGIYLGAPLRSNEYHLIVPPAFPHVFFCKELFLMAEKGLDGIKEQIRRLGFIIPKSLAEWTQIEGMADQKEPPEVLLVKNVMVMLGHGLSSGKEDKQWVFKRIRKNRQRNCFGIRDKCSNFWPTGP